MIPLHAKQLIDAIKSTGKKLGKFEEGFIASVSIQTKQDRRLTDKQATVLQRIYGRVTGGGDYAERQDIK